MNPIPEPSAVGVVAFGEYETWYRVTGELGAGATPLVVLHGGPGSCHDYTLRIAHVAESGRAVVHYDQLGCGRSTHLAGAPADFWTVGLFLDELDNLLGALGIADDYHVLGQSWGGMLGAEHAVRAPDGLRSIVISNSPASMALWLEGANRLRAELPAETRDALERHEADGTLEDPEYLAATDAYYARHVCRVVPNPPEVESSKALQNADPTVYHTMNGPNEFYCVGSLKTWSIAERLDTVVAPTLLVTGRHDEATPGAVRPFFERIPGVRWEVLADSSHMPFVEETEEYLRIVNGFLAEHDA